MSEKKIKVPNIGDFKDVEIIEVLVSNGNLISKNDPLVTIESDKSSVEIPSPYDGRIKSIEIKVGDKVSEGTNILVLDIDEKIENKDKISIEDSEKDIKNIDNNIKKNEIIQTDSKKIPASPRVRKFARELGVNIDQINGSERKGRIIENDIKDFVFSKINETKDKKTIIKNEYLHSDFGEVEIQEIPRVKKYASNHLINSWNTIPHVTNHDEVDITEMEEFRISLTDIYTEEKKKITPLAFIIKALASSLKQFPNFNSSIDNIENGKITIKKYYHIGIAVDTDHGLMVPKIRNVNSKNLSLISKELKKVSQECKALKINKKEFFGGSMTITSLGSIGGSFFTPIINYPEVAILGVGRSEKKQIFINGKFKMRTMLPISLSYDHRIIDGAEAARFNNSIKENLGKNFAYRLAI